MVLLLAGLCYVKPVCGEEGDQQGWLTPRRAWGIALFSGSAVLLKKSWDFHQQANETYALYRKAATGPQAELLYESADNRDTKSQMSWMAAAAFALAGWQMLALGDARESVMIANPHLLGVEFEPRVQMETRRIEFSFKHRFF